MKTTIVIVLAVILSAYIVAAAEPKKATPREQADALIERNLQQQKAARRGAPGEPVDICDERRKYFEARLNPSSWTERERYQDTATRAFQKMWPECKKTKLQIKFPPPVKK